MASLAEQQATYYRDPDTGFLMMPGTRRPDGSWRKPRRIKEGYVPQDEVPLYESKGKQFAKANEKGYIPGMAAGPGNDSISYTSEGGMQIGKLSAGILNMKIDTFDSRNPPSAVTIPGLDVGAGISNISSVPSGKSKNAKKKNKNKSGSDKGGTAVNHNVTQNGIVTANDNFAVTEHDMATADPAKKLRNLKKKLRDIETLEKKLEDGTIAKPEPEQLEKVARKIRVELDIEELEKQLGIS